MEHNLDGLTEEQVRTVEAIVRDTGYFPAMLVAEMRLSEDPFVQSIRIAGFERNNVRCKMYLRRFWMRWKAPGADRLALLREASTPKWEAIDENDRQVLRVQYAQAYDAFLVGIGKQCQLCGERDWDIRHHIIPCMYGGINADMNLIALCEPCHEEIHDWLKLRAESRGKYEAKNNGNVNR